MPEETATTTESTTPTTVMTETGSTTTPAQESTYVNPDGTFKDGWGNHFVPEEHRTNTAWLGIKGVPDMVNQITHLQTKLTKQGKGVFPITERSTPMEVEEFKQVMGIPKTPEGYKFSPPKEVAQYYDDKAQMAEFAKVANKMNLNNDQYVAVLAHYAGIMKKAEEDIAADPVAYFNQAWELASPKLKVLAEQKLREKWGDAYDARLHMANAAINENTAEGEERETLLQFVGNNPQVADFLATIYKKHHTEAEGVDTSLGTSGPTANIEQRISEIMRDPDYMDGRANPSRHKFLINETIRLREMKNKGKVV